MRCLSIVAGLFCAAFSLEGFAQNSSSQVPFVIEKSATVKLSDLSVDWNPVLQNVEAPKPDGSNKSRLQKIKDSLSKVYPRKSQLKTPETAPKSEIKKGTQQKKTAALSAPYLGRNFQGNIYTRSTPNDNDIAISNGNQLISVQNTTVYTCDVDHYPGSVRWVSLSAFAYKLPNPHSKFDPKTIYDPISDKFILIFLNGYTDSTSSITVAFSTTNDPNGSWNLYELPGNPFKNGLWSDYPMLAITDKELFITVNLLYPDSSWQTGFNETLIWQVNKNSGYKGLSLNSVVHHNIMFGGRPVRNLCPVKGGSKPYGPDMYFLSERNLDPKNDTVFLVHLNDTIGAPGFAINVKPIVTPIAYFVPPDALQPGSGSGTQTLATNDSRMLGAFIENDEIQYVHNTLDTSTGNAAVYHGIIHNLSTTPYITGHILGDTLLEFGYPNISYSGNGATDNNAIISFDHAAAKVFPGVSAVLSDGAHNYSPLTTLKSGAYFLRVLGGNERWGDYSGSQRKYNKPGRVWINGLYASSSYENNTWIGELSEASLASISQSSITQNNSMDIYPNPTKEIMNVQLSIEQAEYLQFQIFDANGKLVNVLLRERVKAGKNNFSFSTAPLAAGDYILRISSASRDVFVQKFQKL